MRIPEGSDPPEAGCAQKLLNILQCLRQVFQGESEVVVDVSGGFTDFGEQLVDGFLIGGAGSQYHQTAFDDRLQSLGFGQGLGGSGARLFVVEFYENFAQGVL